MNTFNSNFQKYINYLILFLVTIFYLFVFQNIDKGIDFSDESYSLLRSLYPDLEIGKITYFGYINQFLLNIFQQNLNFLKIFGIFIISLSSIYLSLNFRKFIKKKIKYEFNLVILISICLLGVINFYSTWRLTPNYDYYNLLGVLIFLSGLILLFSLEDFILTKVLNILLFFSTGLLICLISKPSTFIILSFLSLISLIFVKKKKIQHIIISTAGIFIVLFFFYIFLKIIGVSVNEYFKDLSFGSNIKKIQDPRYDVKFLLFGSIKQVLFFFYVKVYLFLIIPFIIYCEKKFVNSKSYFFLIYFIFITLTFKSPLLVLACFAFYLSIIRFDLLRKNFFELVLIPFILLSSYFAASIGTNTNFVLHLQRSDIIIFLIFFYLSIFLKIDEKNKNYQINIGLFTVIFILIFFKFIDGIYKPHRLNDSIFNLNYTVETKSFNNKFLVDKPSKDFILEVQEIFYKNGWKRGKKLIELSGRYPIFNVILDAEYVSKPWYLGGYKGSTDFVRSFLKETDPTLIQNSWIITSDYKFGISKDILIDFNVDLEKDFIFVDDFTYKRHDIHFNIYKPLY